MSWPEAVVAAVAIASFAAVVSVVLLQGSGIVQALAAGKREKRYQELVDAVIANQERAQAQLDDIQATVAETERRIREVD